MHSTRQGGRQIFIQAVRNRHLRPSRRHNRPGRGPVGSCCPACPGSSSAAARTSPPSRPWTTPCLRRRGTALNFTPRRLCGGPAGSPSAIGSLYIICRPVCSQLDCIGQSPILLHLELLVLVSTLKLVERLDRYVRAVAERSRPAAQRAARTHACSHPRGRPARRREREQLGAGGEGPQQRPRPVRPARAGRAAARAALNQHGPPSRR